MLGWLNATVSLSADEAIDWKAFCEDLMENLRNIVRQASAEVAHVKLILTSTGGSYAANLSSTDGAISIIGSVTDESRKADLILNARVQMAPDELERAVREALSASAGGRIAAAVTGMRSLSPGRPQPTHRFTAVV